MGFFSEARLGRKVAGERVGDADFMHWLKTSPFADSAFAMLRQLYDQEFVRKATEPLSVLTVIDKDEIAVFSSNDSLHVARVLLEGLHGVLQKNTDCIGPLATAREAVCVLNTAIDNFAFCQMQAPVATLIMHDVDGEHFTLSSKVMHPDLTRRLEHIVAQCSGARVLTDAPAPGRVN